MPQTQSFASHTHQPVLTYAATALAAAALVLLAGASRFGWPTFYPAMFSLTFAVFVLISISRSYIIRLQDRIILLEMKVRCAELLPAGDEARLAQLSPKQIVALRFASDAELGDLLERAVRERMSPAGIKAAIREWRMDPHRT